MAAIAEYFKKVNNILTALTGVVNLIELQFLDFEIETWIKHFSQ